MIRVSVVIPAYNEAATITDVLTRVRQQVVEGVEFEIVVVDDGSSDATPDLLAANPGLYDHMIRKPNGGKGSAVRAALEVATGDYVLFQDADLEYDPAEYSRLLHPVLNFGADVVMGSRFLAPTYTRVFYLWHKLGNKVITVLFNLLNNTTFTDIYSCYLLYRRSLVDGAALMTDGWDQHGEILSRAVRASRVYYEVPVSYHGRTYEEGKKIRAHHVIGVALTMLRSRFTPPGRQRP